MSDDILQRFSPPVRSWFAETFDAPSPPQQLGWPAITQGQHTLIAAPTGSGKTLAAFLWCLDRLFADLQQEQASGGIHTLYISPLKALNYDVERNLKAPLRGIRQAAEALGQPAPAVRVAVRTGDTTQSQRAAMLRRPPHVLITTPESLFILLTSPRARPMLATTRHVIIDEVHALLGNKRGVSLALSLERLERLCQRPPVRVGLSATIHPLQEAARYLGGMLPGADEPRARPVTIVDAGRRKEIDVQVLAPVPDFTNLPGDSVWPEVYPMLLDRVRRHHTTLIFVRMRAQAERTARAVNELAGDDVARPHHSALSSALRRELEVQLKAGELPAVLSTGTMELGIDVGAIDLVLQLGSPGSVSSGLQRVGRAGHLLDQRSKGRVLVLYREDLVESAVVARGMYEGNLEPVRMPQNALDVVAQHIVSAVAMEPWTGAQLLELFHRAAPYAGLTRAALDTVLALLAGRYPADVARGLSAKLVWERTTDQVTALPGARLLAVTSGGTIPDRGYYKVQTAEGTRLGELEEEFVYERVAGEVIAFGSASWRILSIDSQKVVVQPAPGQPAVIPFWKGGHFGRDAGLSQRIGAFRRELYERVEDADAAQRWLQQEYPLQDWAASNLARYFYDQRRKGHPVGTDRQVVVETFLDDLGDHRVVIHSSFGNRVNAPWSMALRRRLRQRLGVDPQVMSDDDAILLRLPAGEGTPPPNLLSLVDPDSLEDVLLDELAESALFGSLFRQNANRFLVLGTRGVARRNPLWLQRLRAKDLQEATVDLPDFPVRLETFRECLKDILDLPRLTALLRAVDAGTVKVVHHPSESPSPVASGVLNRFMAQYMYEYDEPRGERTLRRLQLDRNILDQMLGRQDVARLLLPEAIDELQQRWQGVGPKTTARTPDELLALVLRLALLPGELLQERCAEDAQQLVEPLLADGRVVRFSVSEAPGDWYTAAEDLPLVTAALPAGAVQASGDASSAPPVGLTPVEARRLLVARVLDSLGPVTPAQLARRCALAPPQVEAALEALEAEGRVVRGQLLAGQTEAAVCTRTNLKQIRRRSLTHAREQVKPVELPVLQKLVLEQQGLGPGRAAGEAALGPLLEQLYLRPVAAEVLERDMLPARLEGYRPAWLDDLVAGGEVCWTGAGSRKVVLLHQEHLGLGRGPEPALGRAANQVRQALIRGGAGFVAQLQQAAELSVSEVQRALWELVWAGLCTNDRLGSLRAGLAGSFAPPAAPTDRDLNPLTGRPSGFRRRRRPPVMRRDGGAFAGRWSLLPDPGAAGAQQAPDAEDLVWLMVARYGLLARELVALEQHVNWSELYPSLCRLELCGDLRRGVFVSGLGAAQFAPVETVNRLRALRAERSPCQLLNVCDPALVAPALHPWAALPVGTVVARRPSSYVVLDDGQLVLYAENLGRRLHLAADAELSQRRRWLSTLAQLLTRGHRSVRVEQVNECPALDSPHRPLLEELGFQPDGKALERRRF